MISHSIPSQDSALMNTPNMANADSNCPTEQERERGRNPGWVWSCISEDLGDNK